MSTTYLIKEGCGTHIVYDQGELERHLKMGWTKRPADWKAKKLEADKVKRADHIAAELKRLQAEQAALEQVETPEVAAEEPKKAGRPRKVAA